MNIKKINKLFDFEVQKRLESPDWSCQVVTWVYARMNQSRADRIINIASFSFPFLAAALLFLILTFGITTKEIDKNEQQITSISGVDNLLDDSDSLSYDLVDYYVDNSFPQK